GVTYQGEVATDLSRHHDLAVRLDGDAVEAGVAWLAEGGADRAAGAEGGVRAAVGVEPGHGEVAVGRCASHHDLAVRLDGHGVAGVVGGTRGKVGGHLAVAVEAGVEAAVGVVPHERDVGAPAGRAEGLPHDHDLAVGLQGDAVGLLPGNGTEIGDGL